MCINFEISFYSVFFPSPNRISKLHIIVQCFVVILSHSQSRRMKINRSHCVSTIVLIIYFISIFSRLYSSFIFVAFYDYCWVIHILNALWEKVVCFVLELDGQIPMHGSVIMKKWIHLLIRWCTDMLLLQILPWDIFLYIALIVLISHMRDTLIFL